MISVTTFAQENPIVGVKSVGIGSHVGFGNIRGFVASGEANYGQFIARNLLLGISVDYQYDNYKYFETLTNQNGEPDGLIIKAFRPAIIGKYYFLESRIRPLLYAEVGVERRVTNSPLFGEKSLVGFSEHFALGGAVSVFLNDKRTFAFEALYTINNAKSYKADTDRNYYGSVMPMSGNIKLGLNYFLVSKRK